jgi:membrane associated rhomboid family serine protease/Tfp pilus assembly protein PilF
VRAPPSLERLPRYPVTVTVAGAAIAATLAFVTGAKVEPLFMTFEAWHGQLWRLVTSALPHVNLIHLAFNVYWLWVFGTLLEDTLGRWKTAAILLLFAAGSSAAEYAVAVGGIGLSGVGYGLFGLLWVLSWKDPRFIAAVDAQTVLLFVAWFFVCIVLTVTKVMPVGNTAHGAGAGLGVLLGFAMVTRDRQRRWIIGTLAAITIILIVAASVARSYVNFSKQAGAEFAYIGYLDTQNGRFESAVRSYEQALRYNSHEANWWAGLGYAYQRWDRSTEAIAAYQRALDLQPSMMEHRTRMANAKAQVAYTQLSGGDPEAAMQLFREVVDLDGQRGVYWYNLGIAYETLGRNQSAIDAYKRATELEPGNSQMRVALEEASRRSQKQ